MRRGSPRRRLKLVFGRGLPASEPIDQWERDDDYADGVRYALAHLGGGAAVASGAAGPVFAADDGHCAAPLAFPRLYW